MGDTISICTRLGSAHYDFCRPFSLMEKDSVDSCTLFGCENQWNKPITQLQLCFSKACNISAN